MSDETDEIVVGHLASPAEDEGRMLVPGSHARIYRDGTVLEGMVEVPVGRPLELRHLPAGSYTAVDETGGHAEFAVDVKSETILVHTKGSRRSKSQDTGSAEPGSSYTVPAEADEPALLPIRPAEEGVEVDMPAEDPSVDEPVLGEPGSSLSEPIEDDDAPDFQLESLKGRLPHQQDPPEPLGEIEIPEEQKPKPKRDETPEPTPEPRAVVIDDRKRAVDPSVPDPKAGEIAGTVLPGEVPTDEPGKVREKRPKNPRVAKTRRTNG
jgi:hypothetical protein